MDYNEARAEIDAAETEWREWESTASSLVAVLEQARDALDAEMTLEAVVDALTALRMADWSSPKAMHLLQEDMTTIENALDAIKCNLENEETVPEDVGEPGDHVIVEKPGDDYDEHGATLRSIEGDVATVTLDDDTVPMQFKIGHLRADPEGTAVSYLRGAINAYRARNVGDAIEHAANAIRRMTRS